mgnify:CR=1 FL=1
MKNTVLIVDDIHVNRILMQDYLTDVGIKVISAKNGEEACLLALKHLPDLIVMDWKMPVMSGIDALEKLKANVATKDILVMIVTGIATMQENLEEAYNKGAIDFIRKPFEKIEFVARVKSLLDLVRYHKIALERKNKELTASTLQLTKLSEMCQKIIVKLQVFQESNPSASAMIEEISGNINIQLKNEIWKRFEEYFTELHPDFYKNLTKKHANISPAEYKLCALLRINMNSKEIAALICQENSSIRVSRSRLRKKFGLTEQDKLVAYLMQF